ncbi:Heat shock protein Hsp70 [Plesiocystis pacifica SIR-1]|uniref:Heat shock protein Hsp70 n=1 Tax=Plesiocystis pacifica SIR-1 TaxID=391625 RepID=A6GJQ9_9BACT|nr:Hsp70 family protein [Plesiocystis pacifica]EDM73886.1 Heat shock protein Hsp70 [Plesiocystis pacifica SIR-1]
MEKALYVGFDLGTTNSAAAVFDGEQTRVVRNSQGSTLTPSVVRIDGRERVTVGAKARRFLERDPHNTHNEFKRLMGTGKALLFPAAKLSKRPAELAAAVLRSLREDVEDQFGFAPTKVVISVPALFELPQSSATSDAARMAGFESVELLQEPIASALAAGWSATEDPGAWLVYDLGGGTFDASLLETADGFLRVVGHDGDNFLGGRDFDWAIVDWAIARIAEQDGVTISRGDPAHAEAVKTLKQAAEEVKIELSRSTDAVLVPAAPLEVGGSSLDVELEIDRPTLETLCSGLVERSVNVCRRLLQQNRVDPGQLERIVFVGGPTMMPFLRDRVGAMLGAPVADGHDPMTLVAQGAAIYAATANLDARPTALVQSAKVRGRRLWLQHPAVSSDLCPHVVGRVVDGPGPRPAKLVLRRGDGLWTSEVTNIDGDGGFVIGVELLPRKANVFKLDASNADGEPVPVDPPTITIVQGVTISDPPLSRTIGVALANDTVRTYFERGTPLPAKRTFTHHTVESVAPGSNHPGGSDGAVLKIPVVQGEFDRAHLCRLVGTLEIPSTNLKTSLPAGSLVELTLELDRGGRLSARALVPSIDQVFEEVAHLLVPAADPEVLSATASAMRSRLIELRGDAFRGGTPQILGTLDRVESGLHEVELDLEAARGGNEDAGQRARRTLIELDAELEGVEQTKRWPELEARRLRTMAWASANVAEHGTPREQKLFEEVSAAVERAADEKDPRELQRQLRLVRQIGETAWFRDPHTWEYLFEDAASRVDAASDLPRAQALVREGRQAQERNDSNTLRRVTERLWRLLPADAQTRRLSFDSGVR